jgi:kynureninase
MATDFDAISSVESWQLSNAPVLAMAALRASLDLFDEAGGIGTASKSELQIEFFDQRLAEVLGDRVINITPQALEERGCQFALRVVCR